MSEQASNAASGGPANTQPPLPAPPARQQQGNRAIHLFRLAGIDVWLHYSWFVVAAIELSVRKNKYHSPIWNLAEYLALFGIVLLHEFGHALACRQTGGIANRIMLWPLGGIAYVQPPPRPGAMLWSIAAGPLINVVLLPVTFLFYNWIALSDWDPQAPDLLQWAQTVMVINIVLLVFNLLPVYPLDGGQIMQSLLWFVIGRANSLYVMAVLGFPAAIALAGASIYYFGGLTDTFNLIWSVAIAAFLMSRSASALKVARKLKEIDKMPRVEGFACPKCGQKPFAGNIWACGNCKVPFNPFVSGKTCLNCGKIHENITCPFCRERSETERWRR